MNEEGLAEDLSSQLTPRPGEERVRQCLVCEHRREIPAGGLSTHEEAFVQVRLEEVGVLDDLETRGWD